MGEVINFPSNNERPPPTEGFEHYKFRVGELVDVLVILPFAQGTEVRGKVKAYIIDYASTIGEEKTYVISPFSVCQITGNLLHEEYRNNKKRRASRLYRNIHRVLENIPELCISREGV